MTKIFDLLICLTMLFGIASLSQSSSLPEIKQELKQELTVIIEDTILSEELNCIEEKELIVKPVVDYRDVNFKSYMNLPIRKQLTSALNDDTVNPDPHDAGNWTGCGCGQGNLVGTYRDVSACAMTHMLKRPATTQDLRSLTEEDVNRIFKSWWDDMRMYEIPDQDVANIIFHIKLHFGNIGVVKRALNIGDDKDIIDAVREKTKSDPIETYSLIREDLKTTYSRCNPRYVRGFLRLRDEEFPEKNKTYL